MTFELTPQKGGRHSYPPSFSGVKTVLGSVAQSGDFRIPLLFHLNVYFSRKKLYVLWSESLFPSLKLYIFT